MSGKSLKKPAAIEKFLPDHLGEKNKEKSLEEQKIDWANYKKYYLQVLKESKRDR